MRCIVHLDLDAFYAAVEHVRKNIPKDEPLGVQQWNHLIAVNYPARKYNVKRMHVDEARKLCPQIHCVHVDTVGEGKFKKAHLGPYRRASVRIIEIIKRYTLKFERASIDEVYMDLTDLVQEKMSKNENLDDVDLGEVVGSSLLHENIEFKYCASIVKQIRNQIKCELGYTCSAGISSVKVVSKLCSSRNKPDKQTIVPDKAILNFMENIPIRKIRMLGGLLSRKLSQHCDAEYAGQLWKYPLSDIQKWLSDDEAILVYNLIRGIDDSEIVLRHEIKSHMSAKSAKLETREELEELILLLSDEILERIMDDYEEHKRWPRTISINGSWIRPTQKSKSCSFLPFKEETSIKDIYNISMSLLSQIEKINGFLLPCFRVSIQLSNLVKVSTPQPPEFFFHQQKNPIDSSKENNPTVNSIPSTKRRNSPLERITLKKPRNSASVFELLNSKSKKLETFYCDFCKKSFALDIIEEHSNHYKNE
eukprot:NODE_413_length_7912_cov_0.917061.p1 type:complete len:478 gc:universal NODE_413_length_7912_cov_0.917061:6264-4831(-)